MNEPENPSSASQPAANPQEAEIARSRTSPFRIIFSLLTVGVLVALTWYLLQQQAYRRQATSESVLVENKVIAIKDTSRKKILTVTVPPQLDAEVLPAVFESIAGLAWINSLSVMGPNVTDELALHLGNLSSLRSLKIANSQMTDEGISQLTGLSNLESLILRGSPITKACLPMIAGMSKVKTLDLSETAIDGELEPLSRLSDLEWLLLNKVEIKDESIVAIAGCQNLSRLSIVEAVIDEESIAQLKKSRPDINVERKIAQP